MDVDSVTTRVVYGCEADYLPLNETVVQCVRGAYNGSGLHCSKVCNLGNDTIPGKLWAVEIDVDLSHYKIANLNLDFNSSCEPLQAVLVYDNE